LASTISFFARRALGFADGHVAVDFLDLGDGQAALFLNLGDAALQALDFVLFILQFGAVIFLARETAHPPGVCLGALERGDEILARHATDLDGNAHDFAFMVAQGDQHIARGVGQRVGNARRELEELEQLAQLLHFLDGVFVQTALVGNHLLGFVVLALEGSKALLGLDRIGPGFGFLFIVFRGRGSVGDFRGGRHVLGRIQVAHDNVGEAAFFLGDQVILIQHALDRARIEGHGGQHLADAFLDALGDNDFALAGQQFDGTHFAHVHAHRIGGAAGFGFHGGQCGGGFGGGDIVGGRVALGHQQLVGVGCGFKHLDAHVVDHLDDVFDLVRVGDVLRQVVVDLRVGQVTLFLALRDKVF
jgi:hypothetical protein